MSVMPLLLLLVMMLLLSEVTEAPGYPPGR